MRIIQFSHKDYDGITVAEVNQNQTTVTVITAPIHGVYALAQQAITEQKSLEQIIIQNRTRETLDYDEIIQEGRLLLPIIHPDSAHVWVTGTGLTHLDSAKTRTAMHGATDQLTDSMKMFQLGIDAGKPLEGKIGSQPEWFYKGDGSILVNPGQEFQVPDFAEDAGEEPEIVGLYLNDQYGQPWRIGFSLGNEFSDHVTERFNYLWLAHSKLRQASFGPELLLGDLPSDIHGESRIIRDNEILWSKPFYTGEDNMSNSIANLEHHHFKYDLFRQPHDLHIHYFGTATLSYADNIQTQNGDQFEIQAEFFGKALVNPINYHPDSDSEVKLHEIRKL
jgi:hypothetical protein